MPRKLRSSKPKSSKSRKRHEHPPALPDLVLYEPSRKARKVVKNNGEITRIPTQYTLPSLANDNQPAPPVAEPPSNSNSNEQEPAAPVGQPSSPSNEQAAASPAAQSNLGHNPQRNLANLQPPILNAITSESGLKSVVKEINKNISRPKPPRKPSRSSVGCGNYTYWKGMKWSKKEVDDMLDAIKASHDAQIHGNLLWQNVKKLMNSSRTALSIERKWKSLLKAEGKGQYGWNTIWNKVDDLKKVLDADMTAHSSSDHMSMLARRTAYREKKLAERRKARQQRAARDTARVNLMDDLLVNQKQTMNEDIKTVKLVKIVRDEADKLIASGDSRFTKDELKRIKKMTMEHLQDVFVEFQRMDAGGLPKLLSMILDLT